MSLAPGPPFEYKPRSAVEWLVHPEVEWSCNQQNLLPGSRSTGEEACLALRGERLKENLFCRVGGLPEFAGCGASRGLRCVSDRAQIPAAVSPKNCPNTDSACFKFQEGLVVAAGDPSSFELPRSGLDSGPSCRAGALFLFGPPCCCGRITTKGVYIDTTTTQSAYETRETVRSCRRTNMTWFKSWSSRPPS